MKAVSTFRTLFIFKTDSDLLLSIHITFRTFYQLFDWAKLIEPVVTYTFGTFHLFMFV